MDSSRQIQALRALGIVLVVGLGIAEVLFGARYPALAPIATGVGWLVGKLLGVPLEAVLDAALQAMRADKRVEIARHAMASLPPREKHQLIEFVGSMHPPPNDVGQKQMPKKESEL